MKQCGVIAFYMRLSAQDENNGESESISNQRRLLHDFINSKNEFKECNVLEFADDGYTGTNTCRPGLISLIKAIKRNNIDCVIVKDFSRLSRNYIDLGSFVEYLFHAFSVRLISVNDCYDSLSCQMPYLDIPFKGIMNEYYSRDLSEKIKTTKRQLIKNGEIKISRPFYGYKKDETGKTYVIDEKTANVVKFIFECAQNGVSIGRIASLLNEKNIPTPSEYISKKESKRLWNTTKIRDILNDERYTGTLILGRYMSKDIKTPEKVPEENWHKFYGRFEPIIDEGLFFNVQNQLNKSRIKKIKERREYHPFYRKVYCGVCGKTLYHSGYGQKEYFYCKRGIENKESTCFKHTLKYSSLEFVVTKILNLNVSVLGFNTYFNKDIDLCTNKNNNELKNTAKAAKLKAQAYEMYKFGKIEPDEFLQEINYINKTKNEITDKNNFFNLSVSENNNYFLKCAIKVFINRINVYSPKEIEIFLNFSNPFKQ